MDNSNEFDELYNSLYDNIERYTDFNENDEISIDRHNEGIHDLVDISLNIEAWYRITQSLMKMLFELEQDEKLSTNQKRIYHEKRKLFGWDKVKSKSDLIDKNLDNSSPFTRLARAFDYKGMAFRREEKRIKALNEFYDNRFKNRMRKKHEKYGAGYIKLKDQEMFLLSDVMRDLRDIETGGSYKTFIDEDGSISALYAESQENEYRALQEIKAVKTLGYRLQEIENILHDDIALHKPTKAIMEEVVYKAISVGYTAGINSNTTQLLMKSKENNTTDNR